MANFKSLLATLAVVLVAVWLAPVRADDAEVSLKGYDSVAYFTDGKPVKGVPEFQQEFDGVRYQFSSAQHRATFAQDPDRYVPQFAGFCAAGMSMGKKIVADPTLWKIVDGKLYVFSAAKGLEMAEKDPSLLTRSQENWKAMK